MLKNSNIEKGLFYLKIFLYSLAAIFAGNTVSNIDPKHFSFMNKIQYQFLTSVVLAAGFFNFTFRNWKEDIVEIIILSIIITATLQLIKYYTSRSVESFESDETESVESQKVLVITD